MMGPYDRRVDHLHGGGRPALFAQGLEHQLEDADLRPTAELLVDRVPLIEMLVQIPPGRAGPGDPEYPVENLPVIFGRPPTLAARRHYERLEKRPFLIQHQSANQDHLPKGSLESRFEPRVNPLCQQDLAGAGHEDKGNQCLVSLSSSSATISLSALLVSLCRIQRSGVSISLLGLTIMYDWPA